MAYVSVVHAIPVRRAVRLPKLRAFVSLPAKWIRRVKNRQQLKGLLLRSDDRILSDIGVTRVEITQEVSRPFWMA